MRTFREQAAEALRALVDEIRLTPAPDGVLQVELYGELGAILALGQDTNVNRPGGVPRRFSLVAGTRNHLYRTFLAYRGTSRKTATNAMA